MIYLTQGATTSVYGTYYEKCTGNPSYFLWSLKNKETGNEIVFCTQDLSSSPETFNKVNVRIDGNVPTNPVNGLIHAPNGYYTYEVYEMPLQSITQSLALGMVATGIAQIK